MDTMLTLFLTVFVLIMMCLYIAIVTKFHGAYNKRFELIYRGGIPLLVFFGYQAFICIFGWNIWAMLLIIEVLANAGFAWKTYNDDTFLSTTLNLRPLNRRSIFLYYYIEEMDEIDANVFQWKKHSTSFETVVRIIEESKLDQQERQQFETEEKWQQYLLFKASYEECKVNAKLLRVEVLGYVDFFDGFRMLIYVHPGELNDHILEGNAMKVPGKIEIEGRKVQKIVCFEGKEDIKMQRRLDMSAKYLDVLNSLPLLESIPNMQSRINTLETINADQRDTMEKNKFQVILADDYVKYTRPVQSQFDMKMIYRLILGIVLPILAIVATFIILSILGVI